ncbi:MAG TPA: SNF2-related protein, partial [Gammaproteobacteria bacterium]
MTKNLNSAISDLFADLDSEKNRLVNLTWPHSSRFPLNIEKETVSSQVEKDLIESKAPLLITGFASLDRIIDFVPNCESAEKIRIAIGHEPFGSRKKNYEIRNYDFPKEVEEYWLDKGISLMLSAKLIRCIQYLEEEKLLTRYIRGKKRLHAKIYCGDLAATLGSSNFTPPGLYFQLEANVRFTKNKDSKRFEEIIQIAENYWSIGENYNKDLIDLLEKLLRIVTWEEALAKACTELLEGEWAKNFLVREYMPGDLNLWPSQKLGIAQALYILSNQGSVLISDATGSGKTKLGVNLINALFDKIFKSGRLRRGKPVMICPPAVHGSWDIESDMNTAPLAIFSHGSLSHDKSNKHHRIIEFLKRTQILCVDEAHNFLNITSNRTQHLLRNMADHVVLFTATPLNRSITDLLRIADMLGADNLEPSILGAFEKMLSRNISNKILTDKETLLLRSEIQKFTVRRTKTMLNTLIDKEPEKYIDKSGKKCRFPKHSTYTYPLNEPESDRGLAVKIEDLCDQLYGVSHFVKPIELPDVLRFQGMDEATYLNRRLTSANKISRYIVMSCLRSSRAALSEHIVGTRGAITNFSLQSFKKQKETGNVLEKLEKMAGKVPKNRLSTPLPDWLSNPDSHRAACENDIKIYRKIHECLMDMSSTRETEKVKFLLKLRKKHSLVLAFDSKPISLALIKQLIIKNNPLEEVIVATGDQGSQRNALLESFRKGSTKAKLIGLCSDSLSEGVNLQQSSVLVHLDMPTVVRIAEQRAGRVDRMDSPHDEIEVWWPDDSPEFSLSSDESFVSRYETVEMLLGSNMPLPDRLFKTKRKPMRTQDIIKEYEKNMDQENWDGIYDAFE